MGGFFCEFPKVWLYDKIEFKILSEKVFKERKNNDILHLKAKFTH